MKFNNERNFVKRAPVFPKQSKLASFVIHHSGGHVTTQKSAKQLVLVVCVVLFLLAIFIYVSRNGAETEFPPNIDPSTGGLLLGEF